MGYDKNIVVLTQPEDYRKKDNKIMPVIKSIYKKYPRFIDAIKNRPNMYNETLDYIAGKEKEREIFVIRPEFDLDIKKVEKNPENLKRVYEIGRDTAKKHLNEIIEYLNN